MIVFVKNGINNITINCKKNDKIDYIIDFLNKKLFCNSNDYWLSYSGKVLLKNYYIGDYLSDDCTIYLNWKPIEICKITSGKNNYFVDLRMIMKCDIFDSKLEYSDNYFNCIIPEKYLDDNIFKNWMSLYYTNDSEDKFYFKLPVNYYDYINNYPNCYRLFLEKLSSDDIIKLVNLFEYLKIHDLHNIICYYIAIKLNEDCSLRDKILFDI